MVRSPAPVTLPTAPATEAASLVKAGSAASWPSPQGPGDTQAKGHGWAWDQPTGVRDGHPGAAPSAHTWARCPLTLPSTEAGPWVKSLDPSPTTFTRDGDSTPSGRYGDGARQDSAVGPVSGLSSPRLSLLFSHPRGVVPSRDAGGKGPLLSSSAPGPHKDKGGDAAPAPGTPCWAGRGDSQAEPRG